MNNAALTVAPHAFANDNAPAVNFVVRNRNRIQVRNVKASDRKSYIGETVQGQHADIVLGESVRIFGHYTNHVNGPQPYNKTFRIGDQCEYDSYNMAYTGPITAITATGVSVRDMSGNTRRLTWHEFSWRNWDYSAQKIFERNSAWCD